MYFSRAWLSCTVYTTQQWSGKSVSGPSSSSGSASSCHLIDRHFNSCGKQCPNIAFHITYSPKKRLTKANPRLSHNFKLVFLKQEKNGQQIICYPLFVRFSNRSSMIELGVFAPKACFNNFVSNQSFRNWLPLSFIVERVMYRWARGWKCFLPREGGNLLISTVHSRGQTTYRKYENISDTVVLVGHSTNEYIPFCGLRHWIWSNQAHLPLFSVSASSLRWVYVVRVAVFLVLNFKLVTTLLASSLLVRTEYKTKITSVGSQSRTIC